MLPACQPAPRGQIKFLEPKIEIEHMHQGGNMHSKKESVLLTWNKSTFISTWADINNLNINLTEDNETLIKKKQVNIASENQ